MADITGSRAVTNAVISPNVELTIGNFKIGYARRMTETQTRPVNPVYEIGTVGIVEMVPGQPAPVTLALEKAQIYGATLVNIIAKAVDSGDLSGISAAAGLSLEDTKTALRIWVEKRLGAGAAFGGIQTLADMPVGFQIKTEEQHPVDESKLYIGTYHNSWITRYTRPIVASGDLLTIETMDISSQRVSYKEGIPVTQDKIEVIAK